MGSDYEDEEESEAEEFRDDMRVFLRLRPINRLEQSRRSKNCIDLHDDPTLITIDSPLEGEYDYTFHHVFEEYATQEEVYQKSLFDVPVRLLEGHNCTVLAYGQTSSGKTHTMLGGNGGGENLLVKSKRESVKSLRSISARSSTVSATMAANYISPPVERNDGDPPEEGEGMIPKTITHLFEEVRKGDPHIEFTIRCSYVEIYLEKILDLLDPAGREISIVEADKAAGQSLNPLKGASELCCLDESDVCALLARGNACRTMSSTQMNTDSSRSHAIFVLRIQQRNTTTGKTKNSVLQMMDLAGSELGTDQTKRKSLTKTNSSAVVVEAMMINKSLLALQKMIRAQLAMQNGEVNVPIDAISRQSKLTRLLRPAFGGNCLTTLLLTASPSSYNIGETINTVKFGQRVKNIVNAPETEELNDLPFYKRKLNEQTKSYEDAMKLVVSLAHECNALKNGESDADGPLWDTINDLLKHEASDEEFKVSVRKPVNLDSPRVSLTSPVLNRRSSDPISMISEGDEEEEHGEADELSIVRRKLRRCEDEVETLRDTIDIVERSKLDLDASMAEIQSEVAVLRTQNENLTADKKKNVEELMHAKNDLQSLSQRKLEVEHNLRTSQFRENESITFLRQFRKFYRNVLKDKAAHGAGSIRAISKEIVEKVPNAPDLDELRDVDSFLLESGLIEDYELGEDRSSPIYRPSKDALLRSASSAIKAADLEQELEAKTDDESVSADSSVASQDRVRTLGGPLTLPGPGDQMRVGRNLDGSSSSMTGGGAGADAGAGAGVATSSKSNVEYVDASAFAHSISRAANTGTVTAYKQTLLKTPGGTLTARREAEHEKELLAMSERCISLQMQLNEERATVDALTNKAGGLSKKKIAQEAITLRQQLEKKTASLTAIAWKMNELNLINKTFNEKMSNREQHVLYLEEQLVELQNQIGRNVIERAENEKKLRDEIENLRGIVDGMTVPLWQFGEQHIRDVPLASRIVVTASGGVEEENDGMPLERRRSTGAEEPDLQTQTNRDGKDRPEDGGGRDTDEEESEDESDAESKVPVGRMRSRHLDDSFEDSIGSADDSMYSDFSGSSRSRSTGTIDSGSFRSFRSRSTADLSLKHTPWKKGTSSRRLDHKKYADAEVQTDEVQVYDASVPMIPKSSASERDESAQNGSSRSVGYRSTSKGGNKLIVEASEGETQTDDAEKVEAEVQTDRVEISLEMRAAETQTEPSLEMCDAEVMTEHPEVCNVETMTDRPEMRDAETMTEHDAKLDERGQGSRNSGLAKEYVETGMQTEPRKIMAGREAKEIADVQVQTDPMNGFTNDGVELGALAGVLAPKSSDDDDAPKQRAKLKEKNKELSLFDEDGSEQHQESAEEPTKEDEEKESGNSREDHDETEDDSQEVSSSEDGLKIPETIPEATDESDHAAIRSELSPNNEQTDALTKEAKAKTPSRLDMQDPQDKAAPEQDGPHEEQRGRENINEDANTKLRSGDVPGDSRTDEEGGTGAVGKGGPRVPPEEDNKGPPTTMSSVAASKFFLDDGGPTKSKTNAVSRFMLGDDATERQRNKGAAANKFMPEDQTEVSSKRQAKRRFLLDDDSRARSPAPGASRYIIADFPSPLADKSIVQPEDMASQAGLNAEDDYDDLGKRWGMSDSELAADTAVLNKMLVDTGGLLGEGDDESDSEDDVDLNTWALEQQARRESINSIDDEEALFENEFDLKKRRDSSLQEVTLKKSVPFGESDDKDVDYAADFDTDHMGEDDESNDSIDHDEFDRMMNETAAALAAADELIPVSDEENKTAGLDAVEEETDDVLDQSERNHQAKAKQRIIREESEDDSLFNDEEGSAPQTEQSEEKTEEEERDEVESSPMFDPSILEGGRSADYIPRRFVVKKASLVIPGISQGGKKSYVYPEPDDMSVLSRISKKSRSGERLTRETERRKKTSRNESRHREEKKVEDDDKKKKRRKKHSSRSDYRKKSSERDDDRKKKKKKHSSSDRKSSRKSSSRK